MPVAAVLTEVTLVAYRTEPDPDLIQQPQLPGVPAGEIPWTAANRGMSAVAPAVNDNPGDPNYGDVYVLDSVGRVEVYSSEGVERWKSEGLGQQSQKSAPVIAPDGDVFLATDRGVHRVVSPGGWHSNLGCCIGLVFPDGGSRPSDSCLCGLCEGRQPRNLRVQ